MNIVITLPRHLIDKILSGEKKVELRKAAPRQFYCNIDEVYVAEKGSDRIVSVLILFTIEKMSLDRIELMKEHLGVPWSWVTNYAENRDYLYAWVIYKAYEFKPPLIAHVWHFPRNPENYAYYPYKVDHDKGKLKNYFIK